MVDQERRERITANEQLKARRNKASEEIPRKKKAGDGAEDQDPKFLQDSVPEVPKVGAVASLQTGIAESGRSRCGGVGRDRPDLNG